MMKIHLFPSPSHRDARTSLVPSILLRASLVAVLLAACAPGAASTTPPDAVTHPATVLASTPTLAAPTLESATQPAASEATALPVATSRGPELHATDPTTVSLASGGLHFVEFFRFT
ncbi:MAG: hypothetical protein JW730_00700 [Anaerolineales bacterium]|nr:hypothetical protein [Anaerolineales bacterium]